MLHQYNNYRQSTVDIQTVRPSILSTVVADHAPVHVPARPIHDLHSPESDKQVIDSSAHSYPNMTLNPIHHKASKMVWNHHTHASDTRLENLDVVLDEVVVCTDRTAVGGIGRRQSGNVVMLVDRSVGPLGEGMTFQEELHEPLGLPSCSVSSYHTSTAARHTFHNHHTRTHHSDRIDRIPTVLDYSDSDCSSGRNQTTHK